MTNKSKQTGQEAVLEQFKPKKSNIEINYPEQQYDERGEALGYTIKFEDIKGYSLNGPYLVVQLHDDTQYVYPMSAVSSLKLYVTE